MWTLQNRTPYAAERTWLRDKTGAHQWMVSVKATFDVSETGKVRLSEEQLPLLLLPEYHGEPGASSLKYEADLAPEKPTTDILVNGCAYTPHEKPTRMVTVSLCVGPVSKQLIVYGTRVYLRSLTGVTLSSPAAFTRRQLLYEWAYGGTDSSSSEPQHHVMDQRNPVGKGVAAHAQRLVDTPSHSIEYPKGNPAKVGPAGFAPLASYWSPRLELAGSYGQNWERTRKPLLPLDYDERHVLCAPTDQSPPSHLRGGERVELLNLSRSGVLRFELPTIRFKFITFFGTEQREHHGKLATVIIEPDAGRLLMVWQSSLKVRSSEIDHLDRTTIQAHASRP